MGTAGSRDTHPSATNWSVSITYMIYHQICNVFLMLVRVRLCRCRSSNVSAFDFVLSRSQAVMNRWSFKEGPPNVLGATETSRPHTPVTTTSPRLIQLAMFSLSSPLSLYAIPAMWVISYYPGSARVSYSSPSNLPPCLISSLFGSLGLWGRQKPSTSEMRAFSPPVAILTFYCISVFNLVATYRASRRRKIFPPSWRQGFSVSKEHTRFVFANMNYVVIILIYPLILGRMA